MDTIYTNEFVRVGTAGIWQNIATQKYYFSDEATERHGPYDSEEKAIEGLTEYSKEFL